MAAGPKAAVRRVDRHGPGRVVRWGIAAEPGETGEDVGELEGETAGTRTQHKPDWADGNGESHLFPAGNKCSRPGASLFSFSSFKL